MKAHAFALPFLEKKIIAENVYEFYFSRPDGVIDFLPGQYIRIFVPHENPDRKGTTRFFTISSAPSQKSIFMITTKLGDSTLKKQLLSYENGDEVRFFGPMGQFLLPQDEKESLVFISGGLGITPFYSMITEAVLTGHTKRHIHLFAFFSDVQDLLYFDELRNISAAHPSIHVTFTLTQPASAWSGETGRISKELLERYLPDLQNHRYFITGPTAMVEAVQKLLGELQIPEEVMQPEIFTGY